MKVSVCVMLCLAVSVFAQEKVAPATAAPATTAPATTAPATAAPATAAPATAAPATAAPATAAPATAAPATGCSIEKIVFATGVQAREPIGASKTFSASVTTAYCWIKAGCTQLPAVLTHRWYRDGAMIREIPLALNTSSGRLWSAKNVVPGNWKVEVVDKAGAVLAVDSMKVE
jgi:hypothetical protein